MIKVLVVPIIQSLYFLTRNFCYYSTMHTHLRSKANDFTLLCCQISTLQNQIHSQESDLQYQEEELSRAKADLGRLQQEETQLEQSLAAGKIQLETIIKSLKATQDEINQVWSRVCPVLLGSMAATRWPLIHTGGDLLAEPLMQRFHQSVLPTIWYGKLLLAVLEVAKLCHRLVCIIYNLHLIANDALAEKKQSRKYKRYRFFLRYFGFFILRWNPLEGKICNHCHPAHGSAEHEHAEHRENAFYII